jgi:hypothetical protein
MRVNKVGWFIVGFFFIGGIFFWMTIPSIFIGQIWVAVSVFLAFVYLWIGRTAARADRLRATGVRGQAEILQMTQTGAYVNNQPRVKLRLRISAPHIAPFEDEKTMTIPQIFLGRLTVGGPLTVVMEPDDPKSYVIDWTDGGGGAGGAPITVHRRDGAPMTVGQASEAGQAVMQALRDHGIDPSKGNIDLRNMASARAAVLEALERHGVDAAHQVAASDPSTPVQEPQEPMERLLKLQQLRDANLITEDEYNAHRQRILGNL